MSDVRAATERARALLADLAPDEAIERAVCEDVLALSSALEEAGRERDEGQKILLAEIGDRERKLEAVERALAARDKALRACEEHFKFSGDEVWQVYVRDALAVPATEEQA